MVCNLTFHKGKADLLSLGKLWVLVLIVLISVPILMHAPKAQASDTNASLGDKALSFLDHVIQIDMSKYKAVLYENESNGNHLFYKLYPNTQSLFLSDTNAIFSFYNGSLGSCSLSPGIEGLMYKQPFTDRFNVTLGIVQRFESWANDPWVKGMENLMVKVGSEKNTFQISGNESLRITVLSDGLGTYKFSNFLDGVEYTGITFAMGNSSSRDVFFTDSRAFYTIGNTTVNVSREQAISIAENYVKNYSYKHTFGNGTSIIVSNLNVTGISSANLATNPGYAPMQLINNSTLFPFWDIRVNVSNMPARGLQGMGVIIFANNGTVISSYQISNMDIGPLLNLMFFPVTASLLSTLVIIIAIPIAIVVVLVVVLKSAREKNSPSRPNWHSKNSGN
jgi:hypothetical protein